MTDPSASAPIRVLIADDHPIVLDGLEAILATQAGIDVVGRAEGGDAAVASWNKLHPDVLLLDLEMPGTDGVAVLRQLRERHGAAVRAIVFTAYAEDVRLMAAVRAGARGYLLKGAPRRLLFEAIRTVAAGGAALPPEIAARLMERVAHEGGASHSDGLPEALTARESEVLAELARGRTNREVGQELGITERTVKHHVGQILAKLGAGNRTEAVTRAVGLGLVRLDAQER